MSHPLPGARLFLVCGLPGSGKTTCARELENRFNAVRFCPDEWMAELSLDIYDELRREHIESLQWKLAQNLLARGVSVIIEWGTWARAERDQLRLGARAIGAAVELDYLPVPLEVLYEGIQRRGMEDPPIQLSDLKEWAAKFEEPPEELALFDPPLASL
ncbi:MAG TPA: ATP-binding protein [Terracidiphilus sp.]|jgi:predicted kinase